MKPSDDIQCCGTCRWAWQGGWGALTPTGRYQRDATSRCRYPKELCLPEVAPWVYVITVDTHMAIRPTDGTSCPCYERNQPPNP